MEYMGGDVNTEDVPSSILCVDAPSLEKSKAGKPDPSAFDTPDWVPKREWADFIAMRRSMGKQIPFTEAAARGIVRNLEKLMAEGHEPGAVLEASVRNSWRDVFPLKGDSGGFRVAGPMSRAGLATMWNANAAEERIFGRVKAD